MSTTTELSPTEAAASLAAARTETVRICHYGTGKSGSSPVLLHLPRTLGVYHPLATNQRYADEFRWLYENGFSATAELGKFHSQGTWDFERGDFERAQREMAAARHFWRSRTPVPHFDYPGYDTAEDEYLDAVGRIARFADVPEAYGAGPSDFWMSHWGQQIQVPSRRRVALRLSAVSILLGSVLSLAMVLDPLWLLATPLTFGPWRTRFDYVAVEKLSLLKWATLEFLPDPKGAVDESEKERRTTLRQDHAEAIIGRDDEFAFDRACDVLRDNIVSAWADAARAEIEDKAAPLRKELVKADDPTRGKGSLLGRALGVGAGTGQSVLEGAPKHDLLVASEALLAEFDARAAERS